MTERERPQSETERDNREWIESVEPLDLTNRRGNDLSADYCRILSRWVGFADTTFETWPERPGCGHFFGGSYWYGNDTANPVLVYAVMSRAPEYDETLSGLTRAALGERAVAAIRFLCYTHDSGPEDCVRPKGPNPHASGRKWGGKGDTFFRAIVHAVPICALGVGSWIIWDELDSELKARIATIVTDFADRWSREDPRNGAYYDTQSEENACTGMGIAFGANMFPEHPHAPAWEEAAKKWIVNCCTVPEDRYGDLMLDGKRVRDWVTTTTTHPDFTVENHGIVHPNYMGSKIGLAGIYALWHLLSGKNTPAVAWYHAPEIYRVLKQMHDVDGQCNFVQSQDWWYIRYTDAAVLHCFMNVLGNDPEAALQERIALDYAVKLQNSNESGCLFIENGSAFRITEYQTAWSFEPQTAGRLALGYLLHLFGGIGVEPCTPQQFAKNNGGTFVFPHGGFIIHSEPGSFASTSWRNTIMHLTMPREGKWAVSPYPKSYVGEFVTADSANDRPALLAHRYELREAGYSSTAHYVRAGGAIDQFTAFTSLPGGVTVYSEISVATTNVDLDEIRGCPVGIRNESYGELGSLAKGFRHIYSAGGVLEARGYTGGDSDEWFHFPGLDWINIDDTMGYLLSGSLGVSYRNRHLYPKWKGIEDVLYLNYSRDRRRLVAGAPITSLLACTFANQHHDTTRALSERVPTPVSSRESTAITVEDFLVVSNFACHERNVEVEIDIRGLDTFPIFPGSGRITAGRYRLDVPVGGLCTEVLRAAAFVGGVDAEDLTIDVPCRSRLLIENRRRAETTIMVTVDRRRRSIRLASAAVTPVDL